MALWWVGMLEFGVPIVLQCLEPMPALFWAVPSLKSYFQLAYLCSDRTLASLPACSRAFAETRTRHFVVTASQAQSGTISALWWKCHGHPSENVTKKYASWLCCCSSIQRRFDTDLHNWPWCRCRRPHGRTWPPYCHPSHILQRSRRGSPSHQGRGRPGTKHDQSAHMENTQKCKAMKSNAK